MKKHFQLLTEGTDFFLLILEPSMWQLHCYKHFSYLLGDFLKLIKAAKKEPVALRYGVRLLIIKFQALSSAGTKTYKQCLIRIFIFANIILRFY